MAAAMAFAAWQERVRTPYAASLAQNDDARVTDAILRAVNSEGRYKSGEQKGQPMWVKWRDLYQKFHWYRLGGATVRRVRDALMADGIIEGEMLRDTDEETNKEVGQPKWTGRVRPIVVETTPFVPDPSTWLFASPVTIARDKLILSGRLEAELRQKVNPNTGKKIGRPNVWVRPVERETL
jgi:hypothetical protein